MINAKRKTCTWELTDPDYGNWHTECGGDFIINHDTPEENGMNYCVYCGKRLTFKREKT